MTSKKLDRIGKVVKSCNIYGGFPSKQKRILKVLRESERPLKPKEIAFLSKINHSTTRSYLRRLFERSQVTQPYSGSYVAKPLDIMGVGIKPLVHNLVLSVNWFIGVNATPKFEAWFGAVKLRVLFGTKRKRITGFVSCDAGMDFDKVCFVIDKFRQVVWDRVGLRVRDDMIRVVSCELNEDNHSIRLDGVNCVTVKDFRGYLERIYNKDGGVRSEIKVKPQSLEQMMVLLKGGMTSYQILQGVGFLHQSIKELIEVTKQNNRFTLQVLDALRELKTDA